MTTYVKKSTAQATRNAITRSLPWYANINWADDEPAVALVLMESPSNRFGVRVSISDVEEARLLGALTRHGGGMYHQFHVTGFAR